MMTETIFIGSSSYHHFHHIYTLQQEPAAKNKSESKPAFIMPARLLSRPIAGEINFLQDSPSVLQSSSYSQHQSERSNSGNGSGNGGFAPAVVVTNNEQVSMSMLFSHKSVVIGL